MNIKRITAGLMANFLMMNALTATCFAFDTEAVEKQTAAVMVNAETASTTASGAVQAEDEKPSYEVEVDENSSVTSLTPEGNLMLVDDIGSSTGSGQQFITLVTKSGNYFYLIIDRNDKGEENVHLLNMVDEADLFALMDEGEVKSFQTAQDAASAEKEEAEAPKPEETEESEEEEPPKEEKKSSNLLPLAIVVILLLAGGGIFFKMQSRNEKASEQKPDPDADYIDDDEEEYIFPDEDEEEEPELTESNSESDSDLEEDDEQ